MAQRLGTSFALEAGHTPSPFTKLRGNRLASKLQQQQKRLKLKNTVLLLTCLLIFIFNIFLTEGTAYVKDSLTHAFKWPIQLNYYLLSQIFRFFIQLP